MLVNYVRDILNRPLACIVCDRFGNIGISIETRRAFNKKKMREIAESRSFIHRFRKPTEKNPNAGKVKIPDIFVLDPIHNDYITLRDAISDALNRMHNRAERYYKDGFDSKAFIDNWERLTGIFRDSPIYLV